MRHTQASLIRSVGCWCKRSSSCINYASKKFNLLTCPHIRLLSPCFKTGHIAPISQGTCCWHALASKLFPLRDWIAEIEMLLGSTGVHDTQEQKNQMAKETRKGHARCCGPLRPLGDLSFAQASLVLSALFPAGSGTFNSLFKELCNFPLWYLSAIGLQCVFTFR